MIKKFYPGQSVKVEHAAHIVSQAEGNDFWYLVEYLDGRQEQVAIERMALLEDRVRATCDEDGSVLIRSNRLSAQGSRELLHWLKLQLGELVICESCKQMVDPEGLKMHVCPLRT